MKLTQDYIQKLFLRFKEKAMKNLKRGHIDVALRYLKAASYTAYTFYIGFTDSEIESMLKDISLRLRRTGENVPLINRCVFYDTFSQDAQGLTMQYVDAIIAAGWEMLYVTEFDLNDPRSVRLKKTLDDYPKAKIVSIPRDLKGLAKVQMVYDTIMNYTPGKLFMHIHPSAVEAVAAFYALPQGITKYQINLTDHTYWVGAGCVDYSFEFREYGASLSVGRRGIPRDRMLLMPYYPMMKSMPFEGFPKEVENKVIIFSGASFYKIIDEHDTFFKLNKAILDANPNAVTLFAGGGDISMLNGLIEKYGLQGRFIPIGHRNDVYECFKHSDIYLSTFPYYGALMAQFAAHASLPILAYAESTSGRVEEVVCQKHKDEISFMNTDALVGESIRLVNDKIYREQRGQDIRKCVIDKDEFNRVFKLSVNLGTSQYHIEIEEEIPLHYLSVIDKLKLERTSKVFARTVYHILDFYGIFICPQLWVDGLLARVRLSRIGSMLIKQG